MACGIPDRKSSVRPTLVDGNFEVQETGCNPGKFDHPGSLVDEVVAVSGVENLDPGVVGRAKNVLLLIGNEGSGIPDELLRFCDRNIFIRPGRDLHPMLDSLNVSVATALIVQFLKNKYLL